MEFANAQTGNAIHAKTSIDPNGKMTPIIAIRLNEDFCPVLANMNRPAINPETEINKTVNVIALQAQTGIEPTGTAHFIRAIKKLNGKKIASRSPVSIFANVHSRKSSICANGEKMLHAIRKEMPM